MSTTKNATGVAKLKSFRYFKDYCIAQLDNGVEGIIGNSATFPMSFMMRAKNMSIAYQATGREYNGKPSYALTLHCVDDSAVKAL